MELGTRFKSIFCGGDFFRQTGNLSIYCLVVLKVVETQRILEIIGCSTTVSPQIKLSIALYSYTLPNFCATLIELGFF